MSGTAVLAAILKVVVLVEAFDNSESLSLDVMMVYYSGIMVL